MMKRLPDTRSWHVGTLALAALLALSAPAPAGSLTGPAEVIDGDGLAIGPVVVRLHGIDAPEVGLRCAEAGGGTWRCDEAAIERLAELIAVAEVTCEALDRDHYGRIIARCWVGDVDLAADLVSDGLAWAFTRYSDDYVVLEAEARQARLGVWQADTQPPWVFHEDRWGRAVDEAPGGCPIKGNINRDGERIYHTPWSPWYGRTQIDEARCERWFCDEGEAVAAGWEGGAGAVSRGALWAVRSPGCSTGPH